MRGGEFSFYALNEILSVKDKELFDAFFMSSLIMFSALGEDLILEDLASRLFELKDLCHDIIEGKTTLDAYLENLFKIEGKLFFALEDYKLKGLPNGITPTEYLEVWKGDESQSHQYVRAGKMIYSLGAYLQIT